MFCAPDPFMENNFHIDLSIAELSWLASAFGLARLPLVLPPLNAEALLTGCDTLLQRKLLEAGPDIGWRAHPFLMLALQWMGSASRHWEFHLYRPNAEALEGSLFLAYSQALLVLPQETGKRLIACVDLNSAIAEWQRWVGFPSNLQNGILPEWDVPQPITIIRADWLNSSRVREMAPPNFLAWARQLDWAGEWLLVSDAGRFARLALAVQGNAVWAGRYAPGRPGEFVLKTVCPSIVFDTLREGA